MKSQGFKSRHVVSCKHNNIFTAMGNRGFKSQIERPIVSFPAQEHMELDWNDEASIHHRTAMNCLDNYALGKIDEECLENSTAVSRKRRLHQCALKFAEQLEQAIVY
jgi:hypothetical protein